MRNSLIAMLIAGFFALTGCGGISGGGEPTYGNDRLEASLRHTRMELEAATELAELALAQAEAANTAAQRARTAVAEARQAEADALAALDAARTDADNARAEARIALAEKAQAQRDLAAANARTADVQALLDSARTQATITTTQAQANAAKMRNQIEAELQAAKDEQHRLQRLLDDQSAVEQQISRRQRIAEAEVRGVLDGLSVSDSPGTIVEVTPRYSATAYVKTNPSTDSSATGSPMGRWFRTSRSLTSQAHIDRIEVFSDVERYTTVPFRESEYNPSDNPVVDATTGKITGSVLISGERLDTVSSGFPPAVGQPKRRYLVDRGHSPAERTTAITACGTDQDCIAAVPPARDLNLHPLRYSYVTHGALGGASGTFRCDATTITTVCTVQNADYGKFVFSGPWEFIPSSAYVGVHIEDAEFMWFGWWARQDRITGAWSFERFRDGKVPVSRITAGIGPVTGRATYTGPAVGQYAMSLPLIGQSRYGRFDATATLRADFDNDYLSGEITNFQQESGWSLTLKETSLSTSGAASNTTDGVSWTIGDVTDDSGEWEARLYSNVPLDTPGIDSIRPAGVAGTFSAFSTAFGGFGALIGVFGAHASGQ